MKKFFKRPPIFIQTLALLLIMWSVPLSARAARFYLSCKKDNDLHQMLRRHNISVERFADPNAAIRRAPNGAGVLLLADQYPETRLTIDTALLGLARTKALRLYIEYPAPWPDIMPTPAMPADSVQAMSAPRKIQFERVVVASDIFAPQLTKMRILIAPGCHFVPMRAEKPFLVLASVAGFDMAVYGLANTAVFPLLFEYEPERILVAAGKLSGFYQGRFAPAYAWATVWQMILHWLEPNSAVPQIAWTPQVKPGYSAVETLPHDVERKSLQRGARWFDDARLLIHSSWQSVYDQAGQWPDRVGPAPSISWRNGNGTLGILEGFNSTIDHLGAQKVRWWRRDDCCLETAGAMACAGKALGQNHYLRIGKNLLDFTLGRSIMATGDRLDPASSAFGLFGWNDVARYYEDKNGYEIYYGDDNARAVLGALLACAMLNSEKYNERLMQCLLANLRTTGPLGFRENRIEQPELVSKGWRHYYKNSVTSYSPHYQAFLWACNLWAWQHSRDSLFLDRTLSAIRMTMAKYPDGWRWTNGLQQERSRMLLPLAWLVRIQDTAEHRQWLKNMAQAMLAFQDECGAIREELGRSGQGSFAAPKSNQEYGRNEAPLIQNNGDPACDLLYTTNFALLGLHEAFAATQDPFYEQAADRLVDFLCRIQVASPRRPELHGAWFRAFDYRKWEYWASDADAGWGAWSIETGWTQSWIVTVLAMRQLQVNLWDLTKNIAVADLIAKNRRMMMPETE